MYFIGLGVLCWASASIVDADVCELALLEKIDPAEPAAPMAIANLMSDRRESAAARTLISVDGGMFMPALQLRFGGGGFPSDELAWVLLRLL